MKLTGKQCLVTGGAGLIGSTITDQLLAEGAQVTVLDDLSAGKMANLEHASGISSSQDFRFREGDIRDRSLVRYLMTGMDYVFHQAGMKILQSAADPELSLQVMASGSFEVFRAAGLAGAKVIAASSASVYGLAEEFPTKESHHPYDNETFYGAAKLFTEGMARSLGLDYVMLRYYSVYGPRVDTSGVFTEVLPRWMARIDSGLPPRIDGNGTNTRDFVYAGDVARANLLAAAGDVTGVFNIGSGTETSLAELARVLIQVMGSDLVPEYGPVRAADPVPRRRADITRARELLGWEPGINLETGLKELVSWWRRQ